MVCDSLYLKSLLFAGPNIREGYTCKKNQDSVDTLPLTDEVHDEPIIILKEVLANVVQDSLSAL